MNTGITAHITEGLKYVHINKLGHNNTYVINMGETVADCISLFVPTLDSVKALVKVLTEELRKLEE